MNTNPQAVRVLCYGDSVTYGRVPNEHKRYDISIRRTGILQSALGSDYEIIEEGLRGRTTHLDHPAQQGRNGLTHFYPCILSHYPLDYIIILLGTNDLQKYFEINVTQSAESFRSYDQLINQACEEFKMIKPKVLLVSPPLIDSSVLKEGSIFTPDSEPASTQFAEHYSQIASELGRTFVDSAPVIGKGVIDGIHLNEKQNQQLAQLIYQALK